jgi:hypothetical protein
MANPPEDLINVLSSPPTFGADEGFTMSELVQKTGICRSKLGDKLRELHQEGRVIVGKGHRLDITGRPSYPPTYRIKETPRGKA